MLDENGFLRGARRRQCRRWDARPESESLSLIVVHNISLPPGEFHNGCEENIARFFDGALNEADLKQHPFFKEIRGLKVSAHFVINRRGEISQFVSCNARAWHAGESCWRGRENCNDFSAGVELIGADDAPYESAQYESLAAVCRAVCAAHPVEDIVGHQHIAPKRKTDPGDSFDWEKLRALLAGLSGARVGV